MRKEEDREMMRRRTGKGGEGGGGEGGDGGEGGEGQPTLLEITQGRFQQKNCKEARHANTRTHDPGL